MEIASAYLDKFRPPAVKKSQPRSAWEEQLDKFASQINPDRVRDGYKPYSHARLAGMLKKAGVQDAPGAYLLYQRCATGHSFSRLFSYLTRV
jgi:hypothetical protein